MNINKKFKLPIFIYCACFASFHKQALSDDLSKLNTVKNVCANWINSLIPEDLDVRLAVDYLAEKGSKEERAALQSKNKGYLIKAVQIATNKTSGKERISWLSKLAKSRSSQVRIAIAKSAGKIGGKAGIDILKRISYINKKSDVDIILAILSEVAIIGGKEARDLLYYDYAFHFKDNPKIIIAVAEAAGKIGGKEGFDILKKIVKDDVNIILAVISAAGLIGGKYEIDLLDDLIFPHSENPKVSSAIAISAGKIGGTEGEALLSRLDEIRRRFF